MNKGKNTNNYHAMKFLIFVNDKSPVLRDLQFSASSGLNCLIKLLETEVKEKISPSEVCFFEADVNEYILLEHTNCLSETSTNKLKIKTLSEAKCALHPREYLSLFCKTHEDICCSLCFLVSEHKDCKENVLSLLDAKQHYQNQSGDSIAKLAVLVGDAIQNVQENIAATQEKQSEIAQSLQETKTRVKQLIDTKFAQLESELSEKITASLENLQSDFQKLKEVQQNIQNLQQPNCASEIQYLVWLSSVKKFRQFSSQFVKEISYNSQYLPEKINELKLEFANETKSFTNPLLQPQCKGSLEGKPWADWGIGGIFFQITAKKDVTITSICVTSRQPGNWPVKVLMRREAVLDLDEESSWSVLTPKTEFAFPDKSPLAVFSGSLPMIQNQTFSFVVDNRGNSYGGHIITPNISSGKKAFAPSVVDDAIQVSTTLALDQQSFSLCTGTYSGNFCGKIEYLFPK